MDAPVAVPVSMPTNVSIAQISGGDHCLGLDTTGVVWAWGRDTSGQLGNGMTETRSATPIAVAVQPGVVFGAIAAGNEQSIALGNGGTVNAPETRLAALLLAVGLGVVVDKTAIAERRRVLGRRR